MIRPSRILNRFAAAWPFVGADTIAGCVEPTADLPPLDAFRLPVRAAMNCRWPESSATDGPTGLVIHGGPGSGCLAALRRVFDPAHWRVFTHRSARRRPQPAARQRDATTADLLVDPTTPRANACTPAGWLVAAALGATLALDAPADPQAVQGLLLRQLPRRGRRDIAAFFTGFRWNNSRRADAPDADDRENGALRLVALGTATHGHAPTRPTLQGEALPSRSETAARAGPHYCRHGCCNCASRRC